MTSAIDSDRCKILSGHRAVEKPVIDRTNRERGLNNSGTSNRCQNGPGLRIGIMPRVKSLSAPISERRTDSALGFEERRSENKVNQSGAARTIGFILFA
jgi:hypothetical protein